MSMLQRIAAVVLLGTILAGCAVGLRTAPAAVDACEDALGSGQLLATAQSGLGLRDGAGGIVEVLWPFGYTARRGTSGIELIGHKGEVLAREGDFIQAGGGTNNDGVFAVCDGTVRIVPPPT